MIDLRTSQVGAGCNKEYSKEEAYGDYQFREVDKVDIMECYCYQQFKQKFFETADITFDNGKKLCADKIRSFTISSTLVYLIAAYLAA